MKRPLLQRLPKGKLLFAALLFSGSAAAQTQHDTIQYSGGIQTFTVPCGVDSITVEAWGAEGGSGATGGNSSTGGFGALGGYVSGKIAVNQGDVINIFVGGQGATPTGGFNGGGNGGTQNAGGGGGATDIRVGGTAESDRIMVAGGGGGGGRGGCESTSTITGGNGGVGGGGVGVNGADAPTSGGVAGGGFGGNAGSVQGAGGAAGIGCSGFLGSAGSTASNGAGADGGSGQACCCFSFGSIPGGGGGGGGYLGGGAGGGGSAGTTGCSGNDKGAGGGGGGGSSYTGPAAAPTMTNGVRAGNGMVVITYDLGTSTAAIISAPTSICSNDTEVYTATGNNTPTSYNWMVTGDLTIVSGQGTATVVVSTAGVGGDISVEAVNACGTGPVTSPFSVTGYVAPTVTAMVSDDEVCEGDQVTFTGGGAASLVWDNGITDGSTYAMMMGGTFTVIGTDGNGCMDTASVTVTVNPLPVVTLNASIASGTICGGQDITLTGSPSGGMYALAVGNVGDLTGNILNPSMQGDYVVEYSYTDGNGCSSFDTLEFVVDCFVGFELTGEQASVKVYPNPARGSFSINANYPLNGTVELYDELGKLALTQKLSNVQLKSFDISQLPIGMYNIKITNGAEVLTGTLSVVK